MRGYNISAVNLLNDNRALLVPAPGVAAPGAFSCTSVSQTPFKQNCSKNNSNKKAFRVCSLEGFRFGTDKAAFLGRASHSGEDAGEYPLVARIMRTTGGFDAFHGLNRGAPFHMVFGEMPHATLLLSPQRTEVT